MNPFKGIFAKYAWTWRLVLSKFTKGQLKRMQKFDQMSCEMAHDC